MNTRNYFHTLFLLLLPAVLFPTAGAEAQYIKKERLPDKTGTLHDFAVFYADGMPETAQWPLGTQNTDAQGRTMRHQVNRGNGDNRNVNSKISARFIISPFDVPMSGNLTWNTGSVQGEWRYAVGENLNESTILNAQFSQAGETGCYWFGNPSNTAGQYTNRRWRMPTQRELMIMMVLQDGINAIYGEDPDPGRVQPNSPNKVPEPTQPNGMNGKIYWSATEESDGPTSPNTSHKAWVVNFTPNAPAVYPTYKNTYPTTSYKLRCVSDY